MMWGESRTAKVLRAVETRLSQVSGGSVFVGAGKSLESRVKALVRGSYCYRWLTAEPDPGVIVIYLRETRTVGPFVRLLETFLSPVERAWSNSGLESVVAGVESALSRSRTGQLLATLLEPPEPPENDEKDE